MRGLILRCGLGLLVAGLCGCSSNGGSSPPPGSSPNPSEPPPALALELPPLITGLEQPVGMEVPGDGSGRLFILERRGTIRIFENGALLPGFFLDIQSAVDDSGGEMGLLGLAFHPQYETNGRFYVNYTRTVSGQRQSVISEFEISTPTAADSSSERVLLVVNQPQANHNGGQLAFGPDGMLYIALGDGGGSNDPDGNGQNTNTLLGKILRIGVEPNGGLPYTRPSDNPFAGGGGLPEIWAYGLRNPWRFSFDRATGRLFAGDVGQSAREEVDLIERGGNYGWNVMEGSICRPPTTGCDTSGKTLPITEYDHGPEGGTSVIGGFVYRGSEIAALVGTYVFGDLSSGRVWALRQQGGNWVRTLVMQHTQTVSSFGQDEDGELYLVDFGGGEILRIVAAP